MTTIVEQLRTYLLADATIAGLVGTRIYPAKLPQDPTMPAIMYQYIDGNSDISTDGPTGLATSTVQVDCWGASYSQMDALYEAVRLRLNGYAGGDEVQGVFLVRKRDLYDDEAELFRRTADWSIHYGEST